MLVAYRLGRYKTNQSMKPMNKSKDWTLIVDYKVGSGSGLNAKNYQGHKIQSGFFLSIGNEIVRLGTKTVKLDEPVFHVF